MIEIFDKNKGFQLHVNFNTGSCIVTDQRTDFKNTFDLSKPNEVGYLINLINELWEEIKKYRNNNVVSLKEKNIINYNDLEELKHEYIHRKELSYSEKLIIEDFYDWLINSYQSLLSTQYL